MHVRIDTPRATGAGQPSERENPGRRWIERGLQVVEEESVVFSTIEFGDKYAGPSGLGDPEVT